MNIIRHFFWITTMLLGLFSCRNNPEPVSPESELIKITSKQYENDTMQLGEMVSTIFENIIKCNGTIVPLPDGLAKINAPVPGFIKNIYCHTGQYVKKNQILFEISGNEIIDIQKDFAEASAHFYKQKIDYDRVKSLYKEKVIPEKDFIVAETDYKISQANYNGLLLKIKSIGFSDSKINDGEFYTSYTIKSPIDGRISELISSHGSHVDPETELVEIINPAKFQIRISVFSTNIAEIERGQKVRFKSINSNKTLYANISSIGVSIDQDSKSIMCFAAIKDEITDNPIAYEFIDCEIITSTDAVAAVPSDAIIKNESGYYILYLKKKESDNYFFSATEVSPGRQQNGFTEILNNDRKGKILIKGAYNIQI